jgi:hypothetical protein
MQQPYTFNRFDQALKAIGYGYNGGACNLSGILLSLMDAIDQCEGENCDPANDPAVRLLVWWASDTLVCAGESDMLPKYEAMRDLKQIAQELRASIQVAQAARGGGSLGDIASVDMNCRALTGQLVYIARTETISRWFGDMYEKLAQECKARMTP